MAISIASRRVLRASLLLTMLVCVLLALTSIFLTLAAGTLQLDGEYATSGPGYILLSSLSVVRFNGFIPSADAATDAMTYRVTLYWFLNAFGFEDPAAPWEKSTAIMHNVNGFLSGSPLTLPQDLAATARRLGLPKEDYMCLDDYYHRHGQCDNAFLAAWATAASSRTTFDTSTALFAYYLVGIIPLAILLQEIIIRKFPNLTQCYCPAFISRRRWCACLKEGEEMTAPIRDRMRLWSLVLFAVVYPIAPLILGANGLRLVGYLVAIDAKVGGMNPQLGTGFAYSSLFTFFLVVLGIICIKLRTWIGGTQSWLDGQNLDTTKLTDPVPRSAQ
jgi:hypothetical protein